MSYDLSQLGLSESDLLSSGMPRKEGSLIAKKLPLHAGRVWRVTTEPSVEPVTLEEAKDYAKLEYDDEDDLVEELITTCRKAAEEYLDQAFIEQTIKMKLNYWPRTVVELPRPPLISVTQIVTLDEDDTETEYDSDNYYLITEAMPGKVVLKRSVTAPENTDRDYGGFQIEFKAGYGDSADDVPKWVKSGIKAWVANVLSTRTLDSRKPPPEAKLFFDIYRPARLIIR